MAAEIDDLQIKIEASASAAMPALDKLINKLTALSFSLNRTGTRAFKAFSESVNGATRSMSVFANSGTAANLARIESKLLAISKIDLSNLEKGVNIDIKMDGASETQKEAEAIKQSMSKVKDSLRQSADDIINTFGIVDEKMKETIRNMFEGLSSGKLKMPKNAMVNMMKSANIKQSDYEKLVFGQSSQENDYTRALSAFAKYVNEKKILYDDLLKAEMRYAQLVGKGGEFNYLFDKNSSNPINLDADWKSLTDNKDFGLIFSDAAKNAWTVQEKLEHVITLLREARNLNPVVDLSQNDYQNEMTQNLTSVFAHSINSAFDNMKSIIAETKSSLKSDKIMVDVEVNQEKIITDIEAAISRASTKGYPLDIKMKVDTAKIKSEIEQQFKSIDLTNVQNVSQALKDLNFVSANLKSFNRADFSNVASSLKKISQIDPTKLSALSSAITRIGNAFSVIQMQSVDTTNITEMLKSIRKFAGKTVQEAMTSADSIRSFGDSIAEMLTKIANAPTIDQQKLSALVTLSSFRPPSGGTGDSANYGGTVRSLSGIGTALGNVSGLFGKIGSLGRKAFSAITKEAEQLHEKIKKVENKLLSLGAKLITAFGNKLFGGIIGTTKGLSLFSSQANISSMSIRGLVSQLGILYAKFWSIKRVIGLIASGVKKSTDLIETYHYFDTAYAKIAEDSKDAWANYGYESAEAYANSFRERSLDLNAKMSGVVFDSNGNPYENGQKNLGLDSDLVMQYQAQYAQQAAGIGMVGEVATKTSDALTRLAGDWSSLRNISFEESFGKMASALAGQSRAVRSLGIDITQANLAQYAANIGLTTSIEKMTQAEKAELRLMAIVDQSRVAWGDLANTLNTPANQMRAIQQNATSLARTIGQLLLPVVQKVLPYINALVIALKRLFDWLANLLGVKKEQKDSAIGGMSDSFGDLMDGIEDTAPSVAPNIDTSGIDDVADSGNNAADSLENAQEQAEELKRTILGFDELNVLSAPKTDSNASNTSPISGIGNGSGGTGNTGTGSDGLGLSDWESGLLDSSLLDLLDEYATVWGEAFEKMQSKAQEIANAITEFGKNIVDFWKNGDWEGLGTYVAGVIEKGLDKIYDFVKWDNVKAKVEPFLNNFVNAMNGIVDKAPFEKFGEVIGAGLETIANTLNIWFDKFNFQRLGEKLNEAVQGLVKEDWWTPMGNLLGNKFMAGWKIFRGFVEDQETFTNLGSRFAELMSSVFDKVDFGLIGETLALGFNGIANLLDGFINGNGERGGFDFIKLADDMTAGLNRFIDKVDFDHAGDVLGDLFNKTIQSLWKILKDTKWETLAAKFNNGLINFRSNINWELTGKAFGTGWNKLWSALNEFVKEPKQWKDLGADFAGFINGALSIEEDGLTLGQAGTTLANAFNSFNAMIKGLVDGNEKKEGIDWEGLKDSFSTNLNNFIDGIDTDTASKTLQNAITKILNTMRQAVTETRFRALGAKVGLYFNRIKWFEWFDTARETVLDALGDFFTGVFGSAFGDFGENFMKGFVDGIKGVLGLESETIKAVASALEKLFDVISKLSPTTVEMLGNALGAFVAIKISTNFADKLLAIAKGILGIKNATAGGLAGQVFTFSGALKNLAGNVTELLTSAGIGGAAAAGAGIGYLAVLAADFQSLGEKMQGYNGILSEIGTSSQDTVKRMLEAGQIEKEQADSLLTIIDDCENAGMSIDETAAMLVKKLKEYGISTDQFKGALSNTKAEAGYVEEAFDSLETKAEELGTGFSSFASGLDVSNTKASGSVSEMGSVINQTFHDMDWKTHSFAENVQLYMSGFDQSVATAASNGQEALDGFVTYLRDYFKLDDKEIQAFITELKEHLPGAVEVTVTEVDKGASAVESRTSRMQSNTSKSLEQVEKQLTERTSKSFADTAKAAGDANKAISDSTSTASGSVKGDMEVIDVSVKGVYGTDGTFESAAGVVEKANKDIAKYSDEGKKSITDNNNTVAEDTNTQYGKLNSYATGKMKDLGTQLNNIVTSDVSAPLHERFQTIAESLPNHFNSIASDIAAKFADLDRHISQSVGDLYALGQAIGQSFANGLSSVHISLPVISWDWLTVTYGDGGSFQVPSNFRVDWFAKGGLFTTPTIAGFGEAGDEAALPLTNKSVMRKIADAITESGGGFSGLSKQEMMESVEMGVAMAMAQNPQVVEVVVNSTLKTNDEKLAQSVARGRARLDQRFNPTPQYG